MFATLGMWDTLLLMVLALVVFGPRRLPKIGRQLGKLMYEFRKASNDFKFQMEEELRQSEEADRRKKEEEERQRALAPATPPQARTATAQATDSGSASTESAAPAAQENPGAAGTTDPYLNAGAAPAGRDAPPADEASAPAAEIAVSEAVEAAKLRIQPPSTGETVAAERPGPTPQPDAPESVTSEAERTEPAAHHG